jgi:regulator of telomere elongation helicase 1
VRDTKVYFPYEPYKVQLEYMENVIEALEVRGNAVLESPTGTGKTLCLLASVLSFVEKQYRN